MLLTFVGPEAECALSAWGPVVIIPQTEHGRDDMVWWSIVQQALLKRRQFERVWDRSIDMYLTPN